MANPSVTAFFRYLQACANPRDGGILAAPTITTGDLRMANRREFLQGSAAAAMLVLSPALLAAVDTLNARQSLPLYKVLFDARHAASQRFAAVFAEQGIATYGLPKGDITPFWRNELAAVWASSPAPIAGLTDGSVLFCLEQLGPQFGVRVLHREPQAGLIAWVVAPRYS
jgi:hypothetical protein